MSSNNNKSLEKYVSEANQVIQLHFPSYQDQEEADSEFYHPDFSYPFFGEEELIYGMRGLSLKLSFTAASLRPLIELNYRQALRGVNPLKAAVEPILDRMYSWTENPLKRDGTLWTSRSEQFTQWQQEDQSQWRPVGEKIHQYSLGGRDGETERVFEVFQADFETPGAMDLHRRLQTFLWWYIEGASYIEESDPRWQLYFIVEKLHDDEQQYRTVGYVTCYPFFYYPDSTRMRISQFLILPHYQNKGHGGTIYRFLHDRFRIDSTVAEICVEDPSEGFSDLRFRNDLRLLLTDKALPTDGRAAASAEEVEAMRSRYKFGRRHAVELAECYMLKYLDKRNSAKYRDYRIWVKRRIYRTHEETLSAIESAQEVKDKLAGAFKNTEEDYTRLFMQL